MTMTDQAVAQATQATQATAKKSPKVTVAVQPQSEALQALQALQALLRPLGDGEVAKNTFHVLRPKVAKIEYTFTPTEDKKRYACTSVLDFSNCSDDEILELATKSITIRLQNARRALPLSEACNPKLHATVDVKEEISGGRKTADPATQARSAIGRLSTDEARKLLDELQKTLK